MVVAEARRTFTYLSLFGYHVDAVIANRMLPDAIDDPWFARWKATQSAHLDTIKDAFGPLPVLAAELAGHELVGARAALRVRAHRSTARSIRRRASPRSNRCASTPSATTLVLSVHLPFTDRDDVASAAATKSCSSRSVRTGARSCSPTACCGVRSAGAHLVGDRLEVEFA